jgi:hypothetical protein
MKNPLTKLNSWIDFRLAKIEREEFERGYGDASVRLLIHDDDRKPLLQPSPYTTGYNKALAELSELQSKALKFEQTKDLIESCKQQAQDILTALSSEPLPTNKVDGPHPDVATWKEVWEATDANGDVFLYPHEPFIAEENDLMWEMAAPYNATYIWVCNNGNTPDWKDSLNRIR